MLYHHHPTRHRTKNDSSKKIENEEKKLFTFSKFKLPLPHGNTAIYILVMVYNNLDLVKLSGLLENVLAF
jgi:hypothetical protein